MTSAHTTPLLVLDHVSRTYQVQRQTIKAVDDLSLSIQPGEIVCLVGESGCGKTTTGKMIAGLTPPSSGKILFNGQDIQALNKRDYNDFRLAMQMVQQDPYASLNPAHIIYDIIAAPLQRHGLTQGDLATRQRVRELLDTVDLTPVDDFLDKFPHQLSGGQRQRVSVARALTVNPKFIVADEAVSAVDVSIRVSMLRMLTRLREKIGVAFLFITHDLALARYFAWEGRIGVMYLGRLVELGPARQVIEHPQHPYTQVLLSAIPEADPDATRSKTRIELRSPDVPSLLRLPRGCAFHPRCPAFEGGLCESAVPVLTELGDGIAVACHPVVRRKRSAFSNQSSVA